MADNTAEKQLWRLPARMGGPAVRGKMESQIKYDAEFDLEAPPGGVLKAISVRVEIEPADAGCLIYGTQADGNIGWVEVRGAKSDLELPFSQPHVWVKYVGGLKKLRISTRGWKDAARG